jgi:hypothetical protein
MRRWGDEETVATGRHHEPDWRLAFATKDQVLHPQSEAVRIGNKVRKRRSQRETPSRFTVPRCCDSLLISPISSSPQLLLSPYPEPVDFWSWGDQCQKVHYRCLLVWTWVGHP